MKNKKIFFFVSSLTRSGGVERVMSFIASALANKNFDIHIITLTGYSSYFTLSASIIIHNLESDKKAISMRAFYIISSILHLLKKERPDFFISIGASLCFYSFIPSYLHKAKYLLWEHFSTSYKWNIYTSSIARKLSALCCDTIIVLTNEDKLYYERKGARNVIVFPNPITLVRDEEKVLSPRENIVLAVGRLVKVKGFDILLETWRRIPLKKEWKLYIVGDGEEREQLKSFVMKHHLESSVNICSSTDDIAKYYSRAKIYALSSRSECFPMVLLEASAFQLPIIAYDCSEGVRLLIKDGINGYLIKPFDIVAYSQKLDLLMSDKEKRTKLGDNGLIISRRYSADNIIRQWVDLFLS